VTKFSSSEKIKRPACERRQSDWLLEVAWEFVIIIIGHSYKHNGLDPIAHFCTQYFIDHVVLYLRCKGIINVE
jgi:hypothetical protein